MNYYSLFFIIIEIFELIIKVYAENNYYIISIRRSENDKEYDNESEEIQNAIDNLVNDRMNDIYEIIIDNTDTYILENGEKDEKLNELEIISLKKRNNINKNKKFRFINKNRPKSNNYKRSYNSTEFEIENGISNNDDEEYISMESVLINQICPVGNYYAINVYLSDDIIEEVMKLPNVIDCEKSVEMKYQVADEEISNQYYDQQYIKKETNWTDVSVQEQKTLFTNSFSHLSLISQAKYVKDNTMKYDNNYYYPSSAGKGVDIYLIDAGIDLNLTDFNYFEEKEDERVVVCDAVIRSSKIYPVTEENKNFCTHDDTYPDHGVMVASVSAGSIYGVAKKANIHMLATSLQLSDTLAAFDYIKQNGTPHKTVINLSRGNWTNYSKSTQEKITELINAGFILIVASGNEGRNGCTNIKTSFNYYSEYDGVIAVGATGDVRNDFIEEAYSAASYSNYGNCVDIHAPGQVYFATNNKEKGYDWKRGTSCATPIVAGIAATLMSEHPEIEWTYELMKEKLIELSLKGVINNLGSEDTPNRFANNGKYTIFSPLNVYNGCGHSSGDIKCDQGCCTKDDQCIEYSSDNLSPLCFVENGCQSEFGQCSFDKYIPSSTTTINIATPTLSSASNCNKKITFYDKEEYNNFEDFYVRYIDHVEDNENSTMTKKAYDCYLSDTKSSVLKIEAILYCGKLYETDDLVKYDIDFNMDTTVFFNDIAILLEEVYFVNLVSSNNKKFYIHPINKDMITLVYDNYFQNKTIILEKDDFSKRITINNDHFYLWYDNDFADTVEYNHFFYPFNSTSEAEDICISDKHLLKLKNFLDSKKIKEEEENDIESTTTSQVEVEIPTVTSEPIQTITISKKYDDEEEEEEPNSDDINGIIEVVTEEPEYIATEVIEYKITTSQVEIPTTTSVSTKTVTITRSRKHDDEEEEEEPNSDDINGIIEVVTEEPEYIATEVIEYKITTSQVEIPTITSASTKTITITRSRNHDNEEEEEEPNSDDINGIIEVVTEEPEYIATEVIEYKITTSQVEIPTITSASTKTVTITRSGKHDDEEEEEEPNSDDINGIIEVVTEEPEYTATELIEDEPTLISKSKKKK